MQIVKEYLYMMCDMYLSINVGRNISCIFKIILPARCCTDILGYIDQRSRHQNLLGPSTIIINKLHRIFSLYFGSKCMYIFYQGFDQTHLCRFIIDNIRIVPFIYIYIYELIDLRIKRYIVWSKQQSSLYGRKLKHGKLCCKDTMGPYS